MVKVKICKNSTKSPQVYPIVYGMFKPHISARLMIQCSYSTALVFFNLVESKINPLNTLARIQHAICK